MTITDSFGYQLAESRVARGWTERQVAEALNKMPHKITQLFTFQDVKDWENLKSVPTVEVVEILAQKLIDENSQLAHTDNNALREAFIAAANRDRAALMRGEDLSDLFLQNKSPFATMLSALRNKQNISEVQLAEICKQQSDVEPITTDDILAFQFGLKNPSNSQAERIAELMNIDLSVIAQSSAPIDISQPDAVPPGALPVDSCAPEGPTGVPENMPTKEPAPRLDTLSVERKGKISDVRLEELDEKALLIANTLREFLARKNLSHLLPQEMKSRGASGVIPYELDGKAIPRMIGRIYRDLLSSRAIEDPNDFAVWTDISTSWASLHKTYQQECSRLASGTPG